MSALAQMLCGDEVASIVVDIGASFCKFGSSGQDVPNHLFRSDIGILSREDYSNNFICGDSELRVLRDNLDIVNPFCPQEVNWEQVESLYEYGVSSRMKLNPADFPVMYIDSNYGQNSHKEKILEFLFETHSVPATFIAPSGMVSAFCNGRPTSLVIDIGARETRVVPVVDGYTLKNAVVVTKRGGNWIDKNIFSHLESSNNIPLKLWFDKSNQAFNPTSSFRTMHTMDIIQDIKKWMCFVPKDTLTPELLDSLNMPPYELPDGTQISPCIEICSLPGHLFSSDREHLKILSNFNASLPAHLQPIDIEHDESSLQELIQIAISKCDVDVRKELLSNISLCGGGAGFDGLIPRLTHELSSILPSNYKIKVLPLLPIERRFSAWIGGSILAICGTFQQLWISSKEYEEYGSNILLKSKCIY